MMALRTPHCVTLNTTVQMRAEQFTDATVFILLMFYDIGGGVGCFWLLYYLPIPTPCLSGGLGNLRQPGC